MVKKNIKNTIKKHNLINAGEHIVIGLSGGPDSVCLFSVLNELKEELQITLHAVHVNHGFRPGAADEDQQYVEQLCEKCGVECTSFIYNCNGIAKENGLSSEEAGRKVRYESFVKVAETLMRTGSTAIDCDPKARGTDGAGEPVPADKIKIAVAQNADDQAETVLFRLLRGTGTDGLAGMSYSRMEKNICVIRPLLDTWRKDIEAYCNAQGLAPRTDHTNLQPIYTRNKIRLDLIPYLQEHFNPNVTEGLARLSSIAGEDKAYLWQCAEEAYNRLRISENSLHNTAGSGSVSLDAISSGGSVSPDAISSGQQGLAEVKHSITLDQQGLAEVKHSITLDQQGLAEVKHSITLDQQGLAEVKHSITLDQQGLADLPPAVRHRVIMKALQDLGLTQDVTASHLDAVDSILSAVGESKTVEFPGGYRVSVRYGEVAFYNAGRLSSSNFAAGTANTPDTSPAPHTNEAGVESHTPALQTGETGAKSHTPDTLNTSNATHHGNCQPAACGKNARFSSGVCQIDEFLAKSHTPAPRGDQSADFDTIRHATNNQTATFDRFRRTPDVADTSSATNNQTATFDRFRRTPDVADVSSATNNQTATFDTIRQASASQTYQSATFDADKVAELHGDVQPVLRTRCPGDYIAIKGGRKKLQNLFVDMKVPKEYRDSVELIAVGSEILWLPVQPEKGIKKARYSDRCKLDMDTKNCLLLEFNCEI